MPYRVTIIDWLLLAGLVFCWGMSFSMSKVALGYVAPEWVAATRLCIGATTLLLVALLQQTPIPIDGRMVGAYFWLGLVGNAAPFFAITWGMQFITSGVAGLLMGTIPLIIVVMAHFALPGERLTLPRTAGFVLGFAGIIVLMGPENLTDFKIHGQQLLGQLAVISGCFMYGINSVAAKRLKLPGSVAISAGVLVAGAVLATVAAALQSPFRVTSVPPAGMLALLGLGLLPTAAATVIWFKAVERTSPTFTALSNYLVPVFALLMGAATLGESIGRNVLAALALILGGIFVSRMNRRSTG